MKTIKRKVNWWFYPVSFLLAGVASFIIANLLTSLLNYFWPLVK